MGKGQHLSTDATFGELVERWYETAVPGWWPRTAAELGWSGDGWPIQDGSVKYSTVVNRVPTCSADPGCLAGVGDELIVDGNPACYAVRVRR